MGKLVESYLCCFRIGMTRESPSHCLQLDVYLNFGSGGHSSAALLFDQLSSWWFLSQNYGVEANY